MSKKHDTTNDTGKDAGKEKDLRTPTTDPTGIYHPDTDARSATVSANPTERDRTPENGSQMFSTQNQYAKEREDILGDTVKFDRSQDTNEGFGEFNTPTASAQATDKLQSLGATTDPNTLKNVAKDVKDTGIAPADGSASRSVGTQSVQAEPTPFMSFLEVDNRWCIRINGTTVYLPPKHEISGLPPQGLFQILAGAVNEAMNK